MDNISRLLQQYPLQFGVDHPTLRTMCDEIDVITPEIRALHNALSLLIREYEGVGLAAPQIGHTVRMAAITQRDTSKDPRELLDDYIMINPVLV